MAEKSARVVIAGNYAVAMVIKCDRLPTTGETQLGTGFRTTHGGKGSNMTVQAARLGAPTEFIGVIGSDLFGQGFQDLLRAEGIGTRGLRTTAEAPTGAGLIITDARGQNLIAVDLGAANVFSAADIDAASELFTKGSVLLMPLEIPLSTALHAASVARRKGLTTILNPAPAQNLSTFDLSDIDFLTPNETEVKICAGLPTSAPLELDKIAGLLLARGCRNVVVTLGEQGCAWFHANERVNVKGFRVTPADTTGAGDAFNAALAVAFSEGVSIMDALRFANATAALSVTKPDTISSYHRRDEVQRLLSR